MNLEQSQAAREFTSWQDPYGRWVRVHEGGKFKEGRKPRLRFVQNIIGPKQGLRLVLIGEKDREPQRSRADVSESGFRRGFTHGYLQAIEHVSRLRGLRIQRVTEIINFMEKHAYYALYPWRNKYLLTADGLPPIMEYPERYDLLCERVRKRDEGRCVQCGTTHDLELDHADEIADGGRSVEENLRLLCRRCHHAKSMGSAKARRSRA